MAKKSLRKNIEINPIFARPGEVTSAPADRFPTDSMLPETAYQIVHDESMLDGNARLNLATFVSTWMDESANKLYSEAFDKNAIDKDEYPATARVETNCWHMLADLIMSSAVQVCWEKFCNYFDVEPRYVPISLEHKVLDGYDLEKYVDENTIGVIAIMGVTYTGMYEPVKDIAKALDKIEKYTGLDIPIHVDAASGGMIAPFIQPELEWDFRIPRVYSINTSGHKYGLVYPGLGWVVWRSTAHLPESLIFKVSYLGGEMPTFALNFSRPGAQILLQYWAFLRYGFNGYKTVQQSTMDVANHLADEINKMDMFTLWNHPTDIPVFAWMLKESPNRKWTLYDLSDRLRMKGWQVPAYPMPINLTDITVQRIVVRNGLSMDLADRFLDDIKSQVKYLESLEYKMPKNNTRSFRH